MRGYFMKKGRRLLVLISAILMMLGEVAVIPSTFNNCDTVLATVHRAKRHPRRHVKKHKHSKAKIWTGDYRIVGTKKSKIFHVIRGHSYRMNRENAVFFKSKAAARAAGYRESKR